MKAAPRSTMPISARVNGTMSAVERTAKADGKAVVDETVLHALGLR